MGGQILLCFLEVLVRLIRMNEKGIFFKKDKRIWLHLLDLSD
jgi:hypothetical protein